jgi:uncharacterized protein (TIRG00374 family)
MNTNQLPVRKWLVRGLTLIFVCTLLSTGYLLYQSAAHGLNIDFRKFKYDAFGAAILILIASWLIEASRLSFIINGMTVGGGVSSNDTDKGFNGKIPFTKILEINLAANFAGNITPFYSGGIPTQVYLLCKAGLQPGKSSAVVTLRVIMSSLVFTILTPFLLLFYHAKLTDGYLRNATTIAIPIAFMLSGLLLLFIARPRIAGNLLAFFVKLLKRKPSPQKPESRVHALINKLFTEIEAFQDSIKHFRKGIYFYLAFLFSALYWAGFFAIAPFLMYACGINVTSAFWQIIFFQFILVFIIAYIPIPSGSGIMEFGFYSVFSFIPPPLRALFIFIWRFLSYHVATFAGGFILVKLINRPDRERQPEPEEAIPG